MTEKSASESNGNRRSHVGERRRLVPGKERPRKLFKIDQNPLGVTIPSWLPLEKQFSEAPINLN